VKAFIANLVKSWRLGVKKLYTYDQGWILRERKRRSSRISLLRVSHLIFALFC